MRMRSRPHAHVTVGVGHAECPTPRHMPPQYMTANFFFHDLFAVIYSQKSDEYITANRTIFRAETRTWVCEVIGHLGHQMTKILHNQVSVPPPNSKKKSSAPLYGLTNMDGYRTR